MEKKKKKNLSLKKGLLLLTVVCWVLPVIIVSVAAGSLLMRNAERSARLEAESGAEAAMQQVELRLSAVIESSKAVSYNGTVKSAFRAYTENGDSAVLYRACSDYLSQNFLRDERVSAVFISFRGDAADICPYAVSSYANNYLSLKEYRETVEESMLSFLDSVDTGIFFRVSNGRLYMVRNLLDLKFQPFAVLCMQLDTRVLFQALFTQNRELALTVDGQGILVSADGSVTETEPRAQTEKQFSASADGHTVTYSMEPLPAVRLSDRYPEIAATLVIAAVLTVPLLLLLIAMLAKYISRPVRTLIAATSRVSSGERGYIIPDDPGSEEFRQLYEHFNSMSADLKSQVEHIYAEQQALQQTRIKALQSQINPHFLNNTLEIINWEARLAENSKVSAMIEALSTLLNAALDRHGNNMVPLKKELTYVQAYLHIIRERLGSGLKAEIDAPEELLDIPVPRLILQPVVENAIGHDIEPNRGGEVFVRARAEEDGLALEVEHSGTFTEEDRRVIAEVLSEHETAPSGSGVGQIGLANVNQRLRLLYEDSCSFTLEETAPGVITASIFLPQIAQGKTN